MNKKHIIIGIVAVGIIVGIIIYSIRHTSEKNTELSHATSTSEEVVSTSTPIALGNGITFSGTKGYAVEPVPISTKVQVPIPSLTRSIVFSSTLDTEVKSTIEKKVAEIQNKLTSNPNDFSLWIDMGIYHKVAGDYAGAKIYWEYISKKAPTDFVALGNLGNMYAYQLKDIAQAEVYYNQAIKRAPQQEYLYFHLTEIYRDIVKDIDKARDTVDRGLKAIPTSTALFDLRNSLK
jgi:hypothetical protein